MLTRHECSNNILRIEAISLKLFRDRISRILVLVKRERKVTSIHRVVFDGLTFIKVSCFGFTDRWNVKSIAIWEVRDNADKLHSIQLIQKEFFDLTRP